MIFWRTFLLFVLTIAPLESMASGPLVTQKAEGVVKGVQERMNSKGHYIQVELTEKLPGLCGKNLAPMEERVNVPKGSQFKIVARDKVKLERTCRSGGLMPEGKVPICECGEWKITNVRIPKWAKCSKDADCALSMVTCGCKWIGRNKRMKAPNTLNQCKAHCGTVKSFPKVTCESRRCTPENIPVVFETP